MASQIFKKFIFAFVGVSICACVPQGVVDVDDIPAIVGFDLADFVERFDCSKKDLEELQSELPELLANPSNSNSTFQRLSQLNSSFYSKCTRGANLNFGKQIFETCVDVNLLAQIKSGDTSDEEIRHQLLLNTVEQDGVYRVLKGMMTAFTIEANQMDWDNINGTDTSSGDIANIVLRSPSTLEQTLGCMMAQFPGAELVLVESVLGEDGETTENVLKHPLTLSYPDSLPNISQVKEYEIRNQGGSAATDIIFAVESDESSVVMDSSSCGEILIPGQSCKITLNFTPTSVNSFEVQIGIFYNQDNVFLITVDGEALVGFPELKFKKLPVEAGVTVFLEQSAKTATFVYPNILKGESVAQKIQIKNTAIVTTSAVSFAFRDKNGTELSNDGTPYFVTGCDGDLPAKSNCDITIEFAPSTVIRSEKVLVITSGDQELKVILSGIGL